MLLLLLLIMLMLLVLLLMLLLLLLLLLLVLMLLMLWLLLLLLLMLWLLLLMMLLMRIRHGSIVRLRHVGALRVVPVILAGRHRRRLAVRREVGVGAGAPRLRKARTRPSQLVAGDGRGWRRGYGRKVPRSRPHRRGREGRLGGHGRAAGRQKR